MSDKQLELFKLKKHERDFIIAICAKKIRDIEIPVELFGTHAASFATGREYAALAIEELLK